MGRRLCGPHLSQCFFRRYASVHHPDAPGLAIVLLDLRQKVMERCLIPDPAECDLFGGFQAAAPVLYRGKRLEGAMRTPVRLREDYDAQRLRALAKASQDD